MMRAKFCVSFRQLPYLPTVLLTSGCPGVVSSQVVSSLATVPWVNTYLFCVNDTHRVLHLLQVAACPHTALSACVQSQHEWTHNSSNDAHRDSFRQSANLTGECPIHLSLDLTLSPWLSDALDNGSYNIPEVVLVVMQHFKPVGAQSHLYLLHVSRFISNT